MRSSALKKIFLAEFKPYRATLEKRRDSLQKHVDACKALMLGIVLSINHRSSYLENGNAGLQESGLLNTWGYISVSLK